MKQDELDRLMAEVGDHDDAVLACVKTPEGSFAIRFEEWDVLAEWDDERQRLMLSVEIGTPPADRVAEIYETLLSYNLLWRATGGVHMGLAGRKGAALQMAELAGDEIAPRQIALVAANLADKAGIWLAYFESEAPRQEAMPQAASPEHVIRA
jgi:hypothetical protein